MSIGGWGKWYGMWYVVMLGFGEQVLLCRLLSSLPEVGHVSLKPQPVSHRSVLRISDCDYSLMLHLGVAGVRLTMEGLHPQNTGEPHHGPSSVASMIHHDP